MKDLRRNEIKERMERKKNNQGELISLEQFSKQNQNLNYIINSVGKKPQLVLVDYEAKEEQKQQEQAKGAAPGGGLLGARGAQAGPRGGKKEEKKSQEEIDKEEEERKKKEEEERKKNEDQKESGEFGEWDYVNIYIFWGGMPFRRALLV